MTVTYDRYIGGDTVTPVIFPVRASKFWGPFLERLNGGGKAGPLLRAAN